jgi:hypothetical protein
VECSCFPGFFGNRAFGELFKICKKLEKARKSSDQIYKKKTSKNYLDPDTPKNSQKTPNPNTYIFKHELNFLLLIYDGMFPHFTSNIIKNIG